MAQRRKRLQRDADNLRSRIRDLTGRKPAETERPMHEIALAFLRKELTAVGHALNRLART